jgi:hypothetical protein
MVEAHLTKTVKSGKSRKTVTQFRGLLLSFPSGQAAAAGPARRMWKASLMTTSCPRKLGDPDFDDGCEIRSRDPDTARRLFDSRARRAVQSLREREGVDDLRIGFIEGDLIIAVARGSNSFEVTGLGQRLADPGRVQAMVEQFEILFDVVDEFGSAAGRPGETRDARHWPCMSATSFPAARRRRAKAIGEIYETSRHARDRFEKFVGAHDGEPPMMAATHLMSPSASTTCWQRGLPAARFMPAPMAPHS